MIPVIDEYGNKRWMLNNELHCVDRPAFVHANNNKHEFWYLFGKRHRTNGPSENWTNWNETWFYKGEQIL